MTQYRFGRLAPHPESTHPRLHLSDYTTAALSAPPASVDWYSQVSSWPMMMNDSIGDCTCAAVGHMIESTSQYGTGIAVVLSDADILAEYERVSGYNPDDPSTDQGAVIQDVLADWLKTGVAGHHCLAFAQVDHTKLEKVKQAIDIFATVDLGIVVTQSMMDAFNAGQPWTDASGQQLGGHSVPGVGYDADNIYVVTWGKVQPMSWSCFSAATEESWAVVTPEWLNSKGQDPQGLDLQALGSDFAELTGQPNPFPAPSPAPTPPSPAPTPSPVPQPPDAPGLLKELAALIRSDLTKVESWLRSHGL